ncbi:MAG TPA: glycosyltransferase [Caldithrix abyssi]|uniref:Glycosyltransferase n=1 Tax=Caldithrix abyssi TaxID=187145 RepID=A0A7V4U2Q6_CALAY|nr:glycosyltransferase [Caldithrix abyssi]
MGSVNDEKLVSVVMAAYNAGPYIEDAIESVLAQEYRNVELLVVNDGSTDDTEKRVQKYLNNSKVKYFAQQNLGQAKAKNKGIREAKGTYIAFLDADDKWTPDKLSQQIPCFDKSEKIGVVFTNFALMAEDGTILGSTDRKFYSGNLTARLLIENVVTGMSSVVKRECFDKVGLFDESLPMGIDYDLWLRISVHYEFFFLDKVLYLYRQWPGQMSHKHRDRYKNAIRIMQKFLDNNPGLLDKKVVNEAWAHTYVGIGNAVFEKEQKRWEALRNYLKAMGYNAVYWPAWKSIIKLILNRY